MLNCWQSPWQNCGQSKFICFPNTSWSLLKGEEELRTIQKKADWMQLSCSGREGVSIVAWTQATWCYLPCFPVMKMHMGTGHTGQEISCKMAKMHNSRYVIFLSLWPLVYLAQIQHSEQLCSTCEGELARWMKGLVPLCIIQLCCWQKVLARVLLCWEMMISTNYLKLVDLCTD